MAKLAEKMYMNASAVTSAMLERYAFAAIAEAATAGRYETFIDITAACPDGASVLAVDLLTDALTAQGFTVGAEADGVRISWASEEDLVC